MSSITRRKKSSLSRGRQSRRDLTLTQAAEKALAQRPEKSSQPAVIVCDVSGSMSERDAAGGQRRIDALRQVLRRLAKQHRVRCVAFSSSVQDVSGTNLPEPAGSTNMAAALAHVAPAVTAATTVCLILISDGEPDSQAAALRAAARFPAKINTFFVGPEGGPGKDFLEELARRSGGQFNAASLAEPKQLEANVSRLLLPG